MYARISTLEGSPEHIDEGLRQVRENVLPQLKQQEGFEGMVALADRKTGKSLGISFWESEEALKASEEAADRLREDSAEAMSDTIAAVERYEVGLFEVASAGPVSGVTDTVGGVTEPVSGVTDTLRGATGKLLGGGEEKQR